jgi:threonine dehydratase
VVTSATSAASALSAGDVDSAALRLASVITPTPLEPNDRLSALTGGRVWLKREDLQPVRSYKLRGAYNLISQLSVAERAAGVVCASAGNHAQGVAFACARLGVRARVFLPRTTPRQKRERVAQLGAGLVETVVTGDAYDDAASAARHDADARGAVLVPAFDDPRTVAGQGVVMREICEQLSAQAGGPPDLVIVPVGGGGLLAGSLTWLAERYPGLAVVGAEPEGAACMAAAVRAGHPVDLPALDPFVDGAAVRRAGDVTYPVVERARTPLVAVPEGQVCVEMLALYQSDGIIAEPAGALASAVLAGGLVPAGLIDGQDDLSGRDIVCILSGGNNDVSRYAEVVERALVFEGRKHYFLVDFPQEPGALRRFLDDVLGPDDDITLFEYVKRNNRETGPALVGIELGQPQDLPALLDRMRLAPPQIERVPPGSPLFRFLV